MSGRGTFYLGEGDTITVTHKSGMLTTFTMKEGSGELHAIVDELETYPIWGFYPAARVAEYELSITGRVSSLVLTTPADETPPGS